MIFILFFSSFFAPGHVVVSGAFVKYILKPAPEKTQPALC